LIASKSASLIYRAWHQKQSALPNDVRAMLAAADLAAERTAAYLRLVILILIGLGLPFPRSWDRKFADSPLEQAGFELVWGFSCQVVVLGLAESSLFGGVSR
jgi:hypothetical protein